VRNGQKCKNKTMKLWTVYYKNSASSKTTSTGFDTRPLAVKFIGETVSSKGFIKNIKLKGKNISAENTFELICEAGLWIVQREN
jgi:hypothetical protein